MSAASMPNQALPPLDAVVFDAGGTLLRLDFEWMASAVAARGIAVDATTLRRAEVEGRRRYDDSHGAGRPAPRDSAPLGGPGDVRAYFGGTLEAAGVPAGMVPGLVTEFLAREKSAGLWTRPMEGARAALEAVGVMGLRRAVVSNSDGRAEWHLRHAGVRDGLEFVVDSHLERVAKPDPRIFEIALARLAIPAERALYVGDIRSVDEAGARAAGMRFVLIDPLGDYAVPGTPAIASIEALPAWIAATHDTSGAARQVAQGE